jgi:hypothetical protein
MERLAHGIIINNNIPSHFDLYNISYNNYYSSLHTLGSVLLTLLLPVILSLPTTT